MNSRTVCPNCRFSNLAQAKFCGDCGRPLAGGGSQPPANLSTPNRREVTDPTPPNLRSLENVAEDLESLWGNFYKIREHNKQGGFLWELVLKHVAVYDLNVKIDNVKGQIEDMWLEGYLQSHNLPIQRILALQNQQIRHEQEQYELEHRQRLHAQQFEFLETLKDIALARNLPRKRVIDQAEREKEDADMVAKAERLGKFIISIEDLETLSVQNPENKEMYQELISEFLHKAMDIILYKDHTKNDYGSYLDELDELVDL